MRRRDFIINGIAYPTAAALSRITSASASPLPPKIVDAHCHIFNSRDLPMVEFIDKAYLRSALTDQKIKPYAPLLDAILSDLAKRLRDNPVGEDSHRTVAECERDENARVIAMFADWKKRSVPLPASARKMALLDIVQSYLPTIVFGFLRRELISGNYSGPRDFSFNSVLDNSDDAFTLEPGFDSDYLANQIYRQDTSDKLISHTIAWGFIFTRSRRELASVLTTVNDNRAVLVTPAIVDFTMWLDASSDKTTTIAEQVAEMGALSRESRPGQPRIHGFVAFDPLRQAIYDKVGGAASDSPLAIVDKAITQEGFIGIKLYPPMGFRPTKNAAAGDDFPCWVRFGSGSPGYDEKCAQRTNAADALGNTPGQQLDDALAKLYAWCAAKNVPIMAHTYNSNAAGPGYGTRANPDYWNLVLQQPQFQTLRINMAHFGGFYEAFKTGTFNPGNLPNTWEWKIGRMPAANPKAMIFSDISYLSEVLDKKSTLRKQTLAAMSQFLKEFPNSDRLLLYGTDWSMIGHEAKFPAPHQEQYPDLVAEFLTQVGFNSDQLENIFFRNAARFLGLLASDRANGTRGRLEAFYGAPANSTWLQVFDQVS
jgi:predicted TIM-barrel fold metal-dependent hydrolase